MICALGSKKYCLPRGAEQVPKRVVAEMDLDAREILTRVAESRGLTTPELNRSAFKDEYYAIE